MYNIFLDQHIFMNLRNTQNITLIPSTMSMRESRVLGTCNYRVVSYYCIFRLFLEHNTPFMNIEFCCRCLQYWHTIRYFTLGSGMSVSIMGTSTDKLVGYIKESLG